MMCPQQAISLSMESTNPQAARIDRQNRRQPRQHFLGGFVGEGHGQQTAGRHLARRDQPGNAGGKHARLARTGTRQNQCGLGGQRDGGELFGIEVLQEILHLRIIRCETARASRAVASCGTY